MNPTQLYRDTIRRITTWLMLLGLVYQFGACPCGCLEHNAWLQMLGLSIHDSADAAASNELRASGADACDVAVPEEHDCAGHPRVLYVNNAEPSPRLALLRSVDGTTAVDSARAASIAVGSPSDFSRGSPGLPMLRARLATLQVFLL